ncbi:MAG: NAD(P)/FAD-dependent oxidoreductase [Rickettsiaceae bacterium]|nr:NAD(P)/FAD-dependent oxidoreductase [Rickettsiaceae bacterium]
MEHNTDIVIVGAGPVGIFAVFQAGILGMKCHVVDNLDILGGQCSALYPEKPIYDIPAFKKVSGQELIDNLLEQANQFEPKYHLSQIVTTIDKLDDDFVVYTNKGIKITCKVIIIAAGNGCFVPNRPDYLEALAEFENKSVFYAISDKKIFTGKNVAIAGGGDSAADWAVEIANIANKVYLIHRRKEFRCLPVTLNLIHELVQLGKIELVVPYQLEGLNGSNGKLVSLDVKDFDDKTKNLQVDFLLAFFGLAMKLGPIQDWGITLQKNKILVDGLCRTNVKGIYAVGDIATYPHKLKLISVGFAEAAYAAHDAYSKVFKGKELHFQYSTTKGVQNI